MWTAWYYHLSKIQVWNIVSRRWDLSITLKIDREVVVRMATGRLFQSVGPTITKARSPRCFNLDLGIDESSLQLFKEVESQTGVNISRDTIRRTLQRNGMHGCRPWKKPLLKPRHKKACLEFARALADKDEDYWESILWSDETKINVFGTDGFKTVWRRKGEEYKEKCMVPTVQHGGASVLCGAAWVLLVSGSCISLIASWIHKCTALYWKRRCYHHSVPLVVVHFSNMTMILNTHLRPLLDFWRRTGWKWFSGQVCLLIWTQSNTYGEFWRDKLSITLHPASNL